MSDDCRPAGTDSGRRAAPADEVPARAADEPGTAGQPARLVLRTFVENKLAVLGILLFVGMVLFCFGGPLVYSTDQVHTNLANQTLPPGAGHPLGTDPVGYDELGRLMLGGQTSLEIALGAPIMAIVVGVLWGTIAGYCGGLVHSLMMRIVDSVMSIPALFC